MERHFSPKLPVFSKTRCRAALLELVHSVTLRREIISRVVLFTERPAPDPPFISLFETYQDRAVEKKQYLGGKP